jgi:hypothetical protein
MLHYLIDFISKNTLAGENIANGFNGSENRFSLSKIDYSQFTVTNIRHECKLEPVNGFDIIDLLGFFSTTEPKSISMCHGLISENAKLFNISYSILFDLVAVHEYAHMMHFHFNKTKFEAGELGFTDRAFYVESWAQWCTYNVCKIIDTENNSTLYTDTFNKLNDGQSEAYHDFKRFQNWNKQSVVHLFLNTDAWDGLVYDGLHEELASEEQWQEVRQAVAKDIEAEMTNNPYLIAIKLKKAWCCNSFDSIKNLVAMPKSFTEAGKDGSYSNLEILELIGELDKIGH